jgi:tetratricopeptide (TPR) repeat protein
VEDHVGTCADCQRVLQSLVGGLPSSLGLPGPGACATDDPPDLPGCEPEGHIAAGGMGVVWRVRDTRFGRTLAVKVMKSALCSKPGTIRRFLAEARITGQLSHPSVVPVHAMGLLPDGRPYFTMKLVEGDTLAAHLRGRPGAASQADLIRIFTQVCHAVAHAHSRGIIHRDLKPANVMVGAFGEVQVMDWGLARQTRNAGCGSGDEGVGAPDDPSIPDSESRTPHSDDTHAGAVMGTLPYMSPEQARGEVGVIDTRSDVFALGAILCEILTGDPPYRSAGRGERLREVANGELSDAYARLDACGADADLVQLAKACLSADQAERPVDAGAVAAAAAAHQLRVEERLRRAEVERAEAQVQSREERKRRRLATGLAVVVLVALAGLAVGAWLLDGKNRQLTQANGQLDSARAEAESKGAQAVRARDRTFQALDAMTSSVTGESLETQAAISFEQRRFLDEVLSYYEEFAREQGDDEATRRRVASAAHRVGLIRSRLGDHEAGIRAFEQARDGYRKLVADFPAVSEYRFLLARSLNNLGPLFRELGRLGEAEAAVRESLELREKLAAEDPAARYREDLAGGYNNLGVLLRDAGKRADAEKAFRNSLALREGLAAEHPNVSRYRQELSSTHNNIGILLTELGADPEEAFRQALAVRKKLVADHPAVPQYRQDLASSHFHLGILLREVDKRPEAEAALRESLALCEKLVTDYPAVPDYRRDLAAAHHSLALVLQLQGKRPEAGAAYRQAVAQWERLVKDAPAVPRHRRELADTWNDSAILLKELGKPTEAEEAHRRALTLREELVAQRPNVPLHRRELAASHQFLGLLLREQGKLPEAREALQQAISHAEKLGGAAEAEDRQLLASGHHNLGLILKDAGDLPGAESAYRRARELREKLVSEYPDSVPYRTKLAATCVNLGGVLSKRRAADSLEPYDRAVAILKPAVEAEPRLAAERQMLRTAHWGRALALDKLGRPADAVADWDRAINLALAQHKPSLRAVRARSLVRAGEVERAVSEADELAKLPAAADQLYDLACVYALAASRDEPKREAYTGKALQLLRRAVGKGYADAEQLKKDDDFKALRDREDFRQLVSEVERLSTATPEAKKR